MRQPCGPARSGSAIELRGGAHSGVSSSNQYKLFTTQRFGESGRTPGCLPANKALGHAFLVELDQHVPVLASAALAGVSVGMTYDTAV